jgi:2-keto-3-deoxy-L-rhamnonate aldolase RhmA
MPANLTIVMLETPMATANGEEIAAVPGVDVVLIGTNDLSAKMGIHGDFGDERVAYRTMITAARKHRNPNGMTGVYNETIMPRYIDTGARFILSGQERPFWRPARPNEPAFCGISRPPSGGYCLSLIAP